MYGEEIPESLVGLDIQEIYMDGDYLAFVGTQDGAIKQVLWTVVGDCCSCSYFNDFYGVEKLINNGPVINVEMIDPREVVGSEDSGEYVQAYGIKIITESPLWGEMTSVVSFRNSSNGYYGGWAEAVEVANPFPPRIYHDILDVDADIAQEVF
jgi:hypothetical protein